MNTQSPGQDSGGELGGVGGFESVDDGSRMAMPSLGFGTYRMAGYQCFDAVRAALDAGYRHVDTAMAYENEAVVGRAIEMSPVERDDVFLTTKIKGYPEFLQYDRVLEAVEGSLQRAGTDYFDLVLLHWWNPESDMSEVFSALNRLVEEGKVRHIGVSNFSINQLRRAMDASDVPILTNQVQYNPYFDQDELLSFCQSNDIILTAYSPLAEGRVVDDEVLAEIGARYDKSAAQVTLRWLLQQENVITIPKTRRPSRIRENIDVFDFELTDRETKRISNLEGPLWFRLTSEGGAVYRFRGWVGPHVPESVRNALPV